ncbi:MAG TPA: YfhO family protein [Verrucomicrobiae bacterium]|nr:YfhO family protein [Verrucomicrobiae bacterium]
MPLKSGRGIFWFAALAGVLAILLHESLFCGKGLGPADGILNLPPWNRTTRASNELLADQYFVFIPTQEFTRQQKSFPLWNPDLCCGVPNLGEIQGALLFPIRLLLSPLDPFSASGLSAFLKLCLAGWFTILYVRLLGVSPPGAFLAGLVFSLSGFMIVWLGHPHVNSAMWLPLLLYFVEKSLKAAPPSDLRYWAGFSLAFAFMILGGHPPTAIHVTIVVALYFTFRLMESGRQQIFRRTALLACAIAVGLLLSAPQILPFLEYYRQSSSVQSSVSMARWSYHLDFASLLHYLLPNIVGNPTRGFDDMQKLLGWHESSNFSESTGYVGIVPLFFALCEISLRRCKFTKFFLALAIGSLLLAFGVPPFPALLHALPIFSNISERRLLMVVGFSLAVLAGFGWDEFNRTRNTRRARIVAIAFCAIVGAALLCFWCVIGPRVHILDAPHWSFVMRQLLVLAGGMTAVVVLVLWPANWKAWIPMAACLIWTAFDLLYFASGFNPAIPRSLYFPKTPGIEWLQKDRSNFRIFGGSVLSPDAAEVFGLSDARGMDFMTVRRYEELITGKSGDFFFYQNPMGFPKTFLLLNVKYVLQPANTPLNSPYFELVYSGEMLIYRYKPCRDRALLVYDSQVEPDRAAILARVSSPQFDPRKLLLLEDQPTAVEPPAAVPMDEPITNGAAQIVSYEPDEVIIDASLSKPGCLLLLDTWFPGWTATVNGRPAPIHRADYNFRAVSLSVGKSTVRFSYRPTSFRVGLYLCAVGVLALLATLITSGSPGRYRRTTSHRPAV